MANEINIVLPETGLSLIANLWSGATGHGASLLLTENAGRPGHYYGDAWTGIPDGMYMCIIETDDVAAIIKGAAEVYYLDGVIQNGFVKVDELHKIAGLSSGNPMTATPTSRSAAGINLAVAGYGGASTTVTRT